MSQSTFNATAFKLRYPEFTNVTDGRLSLFFEEATLYLSNANDSPVQNIVRRTTLLYMLTAHIASLNTVQGTDNTLRPVGIINSASEGSVSVSFGNTAQALASWF